MIVGNTDFSRILSGKYFNDDVEDTAVINMLDGNLSFFEILAISFVCASVTSEITSSSLEASPAMIPAVAAAGIPFK